MGASISTKARNNHKTYDYCRQDCWKNIIKPELDKLHITTGYTLKNYLKDKNSLLEIQCPNCLSIKINIYKDIDTKTKCKLKRGRTKCSNKLDIDDEFKIIVIDTKTNKQLQYYTTESTTEVYNILQAIFGM